MIPPLIVAEAVKKGIQVIAITDHNSTYNVEAVQKAAKDQGLIVIPGMELQTREEVHVLCLFDTLDQISAWQIFIESTLPNISNKPDHFGEQFIVDDTGDFIRREERLLLSSSSLSMKEAYAKVNELGGLFIPAHIDRKAFGLIQTLGLIPEDISIEGLEISSRITPDQAYQKFPQIRTYPIMQNGDVHYLDDFLGSSVLEVEEIKISEIRKALLRQEKRSLRVELVRC